jgi:hypothetical protein
VIGSSGWTRPRYDRAEGEVGPDGGQPAGAATERKAVNCSQIVHWPSQRSPSRVPDGEHLRHVTFDAEQDTVDVWAAAVQKLPDFNG